MEEKKSGKKTSTGSAKTTTSIDKVKKTANSEGAVSKANSSSKTVKTSTTTKKTTSQVANKNIGAAKTKTATAKTENVKPAKTANVKPTESVKSKANIVLKDKTHVLYVCSEAVPFGGTGGLGEVIGSLPEAINTAGDVETRVIMPLHASMPDYYRENLKFIDHVHVPLSWRNLYAGLFEFKYENTTFYFIDNEYFFKRDNLYGYFDDGERYSYFSKAVLELLPLLDWKVDILHCHDWQTALVPIYYKLFYMYRFGYEDIKTVFTIHNIEYQGKYNGGILEDVFGIPYSEYWSLEFGGGINLLKGAIDYSDSVTTVSPTYAKELDYAFYACGLESIIQKNRHKIVGILNGIDVKAYNPKTNASLFENYDKSSIKKKVNNKIEIQKMLSLPIDENIPMVAMITRLVSHKGLDIFKSALSDIMQNNVQVVLLGKGDINYENYFNEIQKTYENKLRTVIAYNKDLSHKLYAAADIFLMPSKMEPCGLSQMMACRYATVPVVRATGGLNDSIVDCADGDTGNGFVFENYDSPSLLHTVNRAVGLYHDYRDKWNKLMLRAMDSDFSWNTSAKKYIEFYNKIK